VPLCTALATTTHAHTIAHYALHCCGTTRLALPNTTAHAQLHARCARLCPLRHGASTRSPHCACATQISCLTWRLCSTGAPACYPCALHYTRTAFALPAAFHAHFALRMPLRIRLTCHHLPPCHRPQHSCHPLPARLLFAVSCHHPAACSSPTLSPGARALPPHPLTLCLRRAYACAMLLPLRAATLPRRRRHSAALFTRFYAPRAVPPHSTPVRITLPAPAHCKIPRMLPARCCAAFAWTAEESCAHFALTRMGPFMAPHRRLQHQQA